MSVHSYNKGFTLVELLITIIIFVFMTALLIVKYGSFSQRINLTNTAYDIALMIRQAQQYGINVTSATSTESFTKGFGMQISSTTNSMIFFRDVSVLGRYNSTGGAPDEILKQINLKQGNTFSYLCAGAQSTSCTKTSLLNIVFTRPDPTPAISGASGAAQKYGEIGLVSKNGATSTIIIRTTGQISIIN